MKKLVKKEHIKKIITIILVIISSIGLAITIFDFFDKKLDSNENITTKLNNDTDFLNWFIDFDKLYRKKISFTNYSLKQETFENINKLLNEENNDNTTYFRDGIYHINDYETLELDTTTRSLRYTKYNNNDYTIPNEILEIRLLNGHYYIIIAKEKYTYKIILNNNYVKKKKIKNKNNSIYIKNSIYKVDEFTWKEK